MIFHLALAGSLGWASGLRLYLNVFMVCVLARYNVTHLPAILDILSNPGILIVAGVLSVIEFFDDKIPYVDSAWHSIQTFIRIPAGALMAMDAINTCGPVTVTINALLEGSLAGVTHAKKPAVAR
jgi:hypothetical protein